MEINQKKFSLDIATFIKALPWLLMKQDTPIERVVERAQQDVKNIHLRADSEEGRLLQLRGMGINFASVIGHQLNPEFLDRIAKEVIKQTNTFLDKKEEIAQEATQTTMQKVHEQEGQEGR